jgi:hypothetical protein
MIFNKEELVLTLREKANEKIERLRQELAESLFVSQEAQSYFVFDKVEGAIASGPFKTLSEARTDLLSLGVPNLIVISEEQLEKKFETVVEDYTREVELDETSYEKEIDPNKKIVVKGVKGMKSTPFTKKFKNMAAFEKWTDSDDFGNYEVHQVMNENASSISAPKVKEKDAGEDNLDINKAWKKFKSADEVISWFSQNGCRDEKLSFNLATGAFYVKGKKVAEKGRDGSYTVDVTQVPNQGIVLSGKEASKNPAKFQGGTV